MFSFLSPLQQNEIVFNRRYNKLPNFGDVSYETFPFRHAETVERRDAVLTNTQQWPGWGMSSNGFPVNYMHHVAPRVSTYPVIVGGSRNWPNWGVLQVKPSNQREIVQSSKDRSGINFGDSDVSVCDDSTFYKVFKYKKNSIDRTLHDDVAFFPKERQALLYLAKIYHDRDFLNNNGLNDNSNNRDDIPTTFVPLHSKKSDIELADYIQSQQSKLRHVGDEDYWFSANKYMSKQELNGFLLTHPSNNH